MQGSSSQPHIGDGQELSNVHTGDAVTAVATLDTSDASQATSHHGHNIGTVDIRENARTHIGDVYNHYHASGMARLDVLDRLMDSLAFEQMDSRIRNVATAAPTTCDWLFSSTHVSNWLGTSAGEKQQSLLWIKGKPGSGKSTIMKKLWIWARHKLASDVTVAFFFNGRSHARLEKTNLGAYRSLTYQILSQWPRCHPLFLNHFSSKIGRYKLAKDVSDVSNWTVIELQEFLIELFTSTTAPTTYMFVDALDECEEEDVKGIVTFLSSLNHHAHLSSPHEIRLRVCPASRHYPHLDIPNSITLNVEDEVGHRQDIAAYIRRSLSMREADLIGDIEDKILDHAAGIFLWAVLIIPVLNDAYTSNQKSSTVLEDKLHHLPKTLSQTFELVLSHSGPCGQESIAIFQWLLASKRSLSSIELYMAVQCSLKRMTAVEDRTSDTDATWSYLQLHTRGLVEMYNTAYGGTVQFIHESVREYLQNSDILLRMTWCEPVNSRLTELALSDHARASIQYFVLMSWLVYYFTVYTISSYLGLANSHGISSKSMMMARCHDTLARGCLQYLSLYQHRNMHYVLGESRCLDQDSRYYPSFADTLRGYAATNLFAHADSAHEEGMPQIQFLSNIVGMRITPPRKIAI